VQTQPQRTEFPEIEGTPKPTTWWPTPILVVEHRNTENLNRGLARILYEKEKEIEAKGKATPVAGLDSGLTTHWMEYNVLNWDYPECRQLRDMVLANLRTYINSFDNADDPGLQIAGISCWANILRHGQALRLHHHDPSFISAHYTVQSGYTAEAEPPTPDCGHTVYYRPGFQDRSQATGLDGSTSPWDADWMLERKPSEGKLLFFPSYVRHEVRPHLGDRERISIAMDIFVKRQKTPLYFGGVRWFVP
jgi:uncharacterized protein (TIGR02466 family)